MKQKKILLDKNGYLINSKDWNEVIAKKIAYSENICLNKFHWQIIYFIRDFYFKYEILPTVRILVLMMKKKFGNKKGNSTYLFDLFPKGPMKQAVKISGLPKPTRCI